MPLFKRIAAQIVGPTVYNEAGLDADLRLEGDTDANLFFLDASTDRIGFGTPTPAEKLNVIGNFQVDDADTATKAYRFRTTGSDLDLDGSGASLLLSVYSGANFTGTQRAYFKMFAGQNTGQMFLPWEIQKIGGTTVIEWNPDVGAGGDLWVFNQAGEDKDIRIEGDTDTELVHVDASVDRVGIGIAAPTAKLDVFAPDNTIAVRVGINAAQASITAADKFISFTSTSGEEGNVIGTAVAGVIAYNTFTGAHKTMVEDVNGVPPEPIMLLEMTGELINKSEFESRFITEETDKVVEDDDVERKADGEKQTKIVTEVITKGPAPKEFLPRTRLCTTKGSKACYGVYAGRDADGLDMALALGTGWVLVANTGINITAGDYFISSDVPGHVELQGDDIKRASTVASSSQDVVWRDKEKTRRVACRYLIG